MNILAQKSAHYKELILQLKKKRNRQPKEIDKFLETQSLKTKSEEIQEMSRLIFSNKIESIIKKLPKPPKPDSFTGKSYLTFK